MPYHFCEGLNAVETHRRILNSLQDKTVTEWLARFRDRNFDVEDQHWSGLPQVIQADEIVMLVSSNPFLAAKEV